VSLGLPATTILPAGGARLECLATGTGTPVTVFAHGLAGDITQTRPLGGAVAGTRVFFHTRGHGRSTAPGGAWGYRDLAADLDTVAHRYRATAALGVSLGAGALCRLLVDAPLRFSRLVFYLPAALDEPHPPAARDRYERLRAALAAAGGRPDERALAGVVAVLAADAPGTTVGLAQRAAALLRYGLAADLAGVLDEAPVPRPDELAAVDVPALVLAAHDDPVHPVEVAGRLAQALPRAELHVYPRPAPLVTARADLRGRISGFLAATAGPPSR